MGKEDSLETVETGADVCAHARMCANVRVRSHIRPRYNHTHNLLACCC